MINPTPCKPPQDAGREWHSHRDQRGTLTVLGSNGYPLHRVRPAMPRLTKLSALAAGASPPIPTSRWPGILVGDLLRVKGTLSGTSVTAIQITDGAVGRMSGKGGDEPETAGNTMTKMRKPGFRMA